MASLDPGTDGRRAMRGAYWRFPGEASPVRTIPDAADVPAKNGETGPVAGARSSFRVEALLVTGAEPE